MMWRVRGNGALLSYDFSPRRSPGSSIAGERTHQLEGWPPQGKLLRPAEAGAIVNDISVWQRRVPSLDMFSQGAIGLSCSSVVVDLEPSGVRSIWSSKRRWRSN